MCARQVNLRVETAGKWSSYTEAESRIAWWATGAAEGSAGLDPGCSLWMGETIKEGRSE